MSFGFRSYSLSIAPSTLEAQLVPLGFSLKDPKALAGAIVRLSDFYQSSSRTSPWTDKWAQAAYLSYFMPLNWVRLKAVFEEGQRFHFFDNLNEVWDFGAGPGTASLAWSESQLPQLPWFNIEPADEARTLGQSLSRSKQIHWSDKIPPATHSQRLGLFSYVLNELPALPSWALDSEALMLVEPSTHTHARALQRLRRALLENGFSLWAPCPHHEDCPLLHSPKDWCHDRVAFERPEWFRKIEEFLPMRNQTVTFSYLLARKSPRPVQNLARLVGDQLIEKGKTRMLVCQSREKKYLTWLHRHGRPPEMSRGALVKLPSSGSGAEIRISPEISTSVEGIAELDVFKIPKA